MQWMASPSVCGRDRRWDRGRIRLRKVYTGPGDPAPASENRRPDYLSGKGYLGRDQGAAERASQGYADHFPGSLRISEPRMSIGDIIAEPLKIYKLCNSKEEQQKKVREIMDVVGLAERTYGLYPHELDGGRRQRVGIGRR